MKLTTRRFRKRFLSPREEKKAMVQLEEAIQELVVELSDRGISSIEAKEIETKAHSCKYGVATQLCMKHIRLSFKEDLVLVVLLQAACNALLNLSDLKFERATDDYVRILARGRLVPSWYRDYKQQRVEHYRHVSKICIKWADVVDQVKFQLILRQDRLYQQAKMRKRKQTFTPTKLERIEEEEQEHCLDETGKANTPPDASTSKQIVIYKKPTRLIEEIQLQGKLKQAGIDHEQGSSSNRLFEC